MDSLALAKKIIQKLQVYDLAHHALLGYYLSGDGGAGALADILCDLSADLYKLQAIHAQEYLVRNAMNIIVDPKYPAQLDAENVRNLIKLNTGVVLIMEDWELTNMIMAIEQQARRG